MLPAFVLLATAIVAFVLSKQTPSELSVATTADVPASRGPATKSADPSEPGADVSEPTPADVDLEALIADERRRRFEEKFGLDREYPPGAHAGWGGRIKFWWYGQCTDQFVEDTQGNTHSVRLCEEERLVVDHPYGEYTIEQLEFAANEMNDSDAAYILAERLWRQRDLARSDEANKYYTKAFLISNDAEIYWALLGQMGLGAISSRNGEPDASTLSTYTMYRVGELFGVIESQQVERVAEAISASSDVDLTELDRSAQAVYESLLEARQRYE